MKSYKGKIATALAKETDKLSSSKNFISKAEPKERGLGEYPSYGSSNKRNPTVSQSTSNKYGSYPGTSASGSRNSGAQARGTGANYQRQPQGYSKLEDKYARGNNEKYMTQWSAEADNVDLYNKFQKPSSDGFDVNDLGIKGFAIRETDFVDVV
eukprot:CAMPEP_0205805448 /NCGR_PEP_ID=MMETSP0205-20121125/8675_1 /ASSEMBLY_ACC=CAM_ASM_000278 /TAXON_ID=36767 /ORGANISM="Euplotes focardii, Strain TN1" /LENGTH=153 /DNA_ID=CAMNT_0053076683 /DNA_START=84 /DNA_END=545 /DNA_ORIENTATION=-